MDRLLLHKLKEISSTFNLDFLILFGSRATGKEKKDSDYDLAFYKKNMTVDEEFQLRDALDSLFKEKNYDLINLEQDHSYVLKHEIFRKGKLLYCNNKKKYYQLKDESFFNYVDSQVLLEPTKQKYLEQ